MKKTARRGLVVLLLVAVVLGGLGFLAFKFAVNGEKWATLRANLHLTENGSFVAAGNITDRNGEILAQTEDDERLYNNSERVRRSVLHIIGDTEGYISSGVQTAYKTQLTGYNPITGLYSLKRYGRGNDIKLTLDSKVCATAYDALNGRKGVVAAYNYKTGELLCSVSSPNYDIRNKPSEEMIQKNENGKYEGLYMNRLIDGLYTPGSTFKIITTASVIENKADINEWQFECNGETVIDGVKITCPNKHGVMNFEEAFTKSCNCAYAVLTDEIGKNALTKTAKEFGFAKEFSFGNSYTKASTFDLSDAARGDVAWAGVGQYTTLVNPYHMLTVLGCVANNGNAVLPYVVSSVTSPDGKILKETTALTENRITADVAITLKAMMRKNVENNYGDGNFKGLKMCGKTGTAEVAEGVKPHSWFVGFSENENCPVAILVVVENGGWGSSAALPVASTVMNEIFKSFS